MPLGFCLPQTGQAPGPDAVSKVARRAEQLGTLTFAAARTNHIAIGTSVLNLPW